MKESSEICLINGNLLFNQETLEQLPSLNSIFFLIWV